MLVFFVLVLVDVTCFVLVDVGLADEVDLFVLVVVDFLELVVDLGLLVVVVDLGLPVVVEAFLAGCRVSALTVALSASSMRRFFVIASPVVARWGDVVGWA